MADARTLGPALGQVVEELELEQPVVVTIADLAQILRRRQVRTRPVEVARRLRDRGWLLETAQRGVFEFAPGAHAGPYGHGDPFIDLRAYLANQPDRLRKASQDHQTGRDEPGACDVAACLHSALWLRGYSDRAPNRHELAIRPGGRAPKSLARAFRIVRFEPQLLPELIDGLPVHRSATVLVHLASKPSDVRSWRVFVEAMPDLVASATAGDLAAEVKPRTAATRARLGYLLDGQETNHLTLTDLDVVRPSGTVWFGPRDTPARYDARWNIADTVLRITASQTSDD